MEGIFKSKGIDVGSIVRSKLEEEYKVSEQKILHVVLFDFLKDVDRDELLKHNVSVEQAQQYISAWVEKNFRQREKKDGNVSRSPS